MNRLDLSANFCQLVDCVVSGYDQRHYPSITTKLDTSKFQLDQRNFFPDGTHTDASVPVQPLPELPLELKVNIIDQAENIADFIAMTQVFQRHIPSSGGSDNISICQESAKHRLRSLGQNVTFTDTPATQLFSHIFVDTFEKASLEDKKKIIQLTEKLQPFTEASLTNLQKSLRFIQDIALDIFNTFIFRMGMTALASYCTLKFYFFAKAHLAVRVIPKIAHFVMAKGTPTVIKSFNKSFRAFELLVSYQFRLSIFFNWVVPLTPIYKYPQLLHVTLYAKNVCLFPTILPKKIFWLPWEILKKTAFLSWGAHAKINQSLSQLNDKSKGAFFAQRSHNAYRIWMECVNKVSFSPV